jgi:hypothetical protein
VPARFRRLAASAALVLAIGVVGSGCSTDGSEGPESIASAELGTDLGAGGQAPETDGSDTDGSDDDADVGDGSGRQVEVERPVGCPSDPGSPTDLASEPVTWLAFGSYLRWVDGQGCSVRIDVISHIRGDAACGYQGAELLTVGRPIGTSIDGAAPDGISRFVWDPTGVLPGGPWGEGLAIVALPPGEAETVYRRDGAELWLDEEAVALSRIIGHRVQVWHPDTAGLGICA